IETGHGRPAGRQDPLCGSAWPAGSLWHQVQGLSFTGSRRPADTAALDAGSIDVARMFTTQGIIQTKGWVVLKDDQHLVAGQHLIPIVRKAVLTSAISKALNAVSQ